jgi:hypothetical protein
MVDRPKKILLQKDLVEAEHLKEMVGGHLKEMVELADLLNKVVVVGENLLNKVVAVKLLNRKELQREMDKNRMVLDEAL